jgi:hypothetical protein
MVQTTTNVGFEVLTAVVMKSKIFWDITPCSPLKFNRHFGGTCRLHLQGRRISQARNQREGCGVRVDVIGLGVCQIKGLSYKQ